METNREKMEHIKVLSEPKIIQNELNEIIIDNNKYSNYFSQNFSFVKKRKEKKTARRLSCLFPSCVKYFESQRNKAK